MVTIARVVEKYVEGRPFLQEALSRGIINNAALAEELIPEVEKELKQKVKFSAVNMGIRRLSEKLEKTFVAKAKFDKNSKIVIQSDLIEITIYKTYEFQKYIKEIYDMIDFKSGDFITITQGINEVMIITDKKHKKGYKKAKQPDCEYSY